MAIIKPTLSILANDADATIAGPLSMALNLTTSTDVTVVGVESGVKTVSRAEAGDKTDYLFDGSLAEDVDGGVAGTDGSFVYLKNMMAVGSTGAILIGIEADDADLTDAIDLDANEEPQRLFSLKPQEFAFFPYDHTMDIVVDAMLADNLKLEWWRFDRTEASSATP